VARTVFDSNLKDRAARGRLTARPKPHYRLIEPGLHLGYRKPRGRKGKAAPAGAWLARQHKAIDTDDAEAARRRRSSANRIFTTLKAALNHAWRQGAVPSNAAWARVEVFSGVDVARIPRSPSRNRSG
jgi:hypothetical protein